MRLVRRADHDLTELADLGVNAKCLLHDMPFVDRFRDVTQ